MTQEEKKKSEDKSSTPPSFTIGAELQLGKSISLTSNATIIKIEKDANEELYKLPQNMRREILSEAVEASKGTIHPYDVTLQEVLEAKKRKGC